MKILTKPNAGRKHIYTLRYNINENQETSCLSYGMAEVRKIQRDSKKWTQFHKSIFQN